MRGKGVRSKWGLNEVCTVHVDSLEWDVRIGTDDENMEEEDEDDKPIVPHQSLYLYSFLPSQKRATEVC
jgi:hypothetical protein